MAAIYIPRKLGSLAPPPPPQPGLTPSYRQSWQLSRYQTIMAAYILTFFPAIDNHGSYLRTQTIMAAMYVGTQRCVFSSAITLFAHQLPVLPIIQLLDQHPIQKAEAPTKLGALTTHHLHCWCCIHPQNLIATHTHTHTKH